MTARRVISLWLSLMAVLCLTGCGPTLGDLPLPGSGVSGDTIRVTADFDEALNLATGAVVKVNGVNAGRVQKVSVKDFRAQAEMLVQKDAVMRKGARARLRYTTPLGELFVDVTNPTTGPAMSDGDTLGLPSTSTAPTVEDTLASASLLVNGGGLAQLQTVTTELNKALGGREGTTRDLLKNLNVFLGQANATTGDIDRALNALAGASVLLGQREDTINRAMRDIRPAAAVLRANTDGFTRLLAEVRKFSGTANETVSRTRQQLLTLIHETEPVLAAFTAARGDFGPALDELISLGGILNNAVPTDYLNLALHLKADALALPGVGDLPSLPPILGGLNLGDLIPNLPSAPTVPGVTGRGGLLTGLLGGGPTSSKPGLDLTGLTGLLGGRK